MRICYALSYRDPHYVRTRSLLVAMNRLEGIEVVPAINRARGYWRYVQMLRLILSAHRISDPDVYVLGFRGHEIAWLVRALMCDRPLVLDAVMSPYGARLRDMP